MLDPASRDRIVAGFAAMAQPGATHTYTNRHNQKVTKPVRPREALRAMKILHELGTLTLEQQRQDHLDQLHNNDKTLNDVVSPVHDIAGDRLHDEAMRRNLSCAAELDVETVRAVYAASKAEWEAKNGPEPERGPQPVAETPPEQRNDWIIPPEVQHMVMGRLQDMVDPQGEEFHRLRVRERLMAGRVLCRFCALGAAQQRLDRQIAAGGPVLDWVQDDGRGVGAGPQAYRAAQAGGRRKGTSGGGKGSRGSGMIDPNVGKSAS